MPVSFGSVCSGIEAASVAFGPLGWRAAWFAEIEPFPCAVLAHHYPDVPNLGDMTAIAAAVRARTVAAPSLLCGGTPCQSFSVAGLRQSLGDARGNLSLAFVELADAIDDVRADRGEPASIILWENVPGVLSTKDNAFGCFLAGLAGCDEPINPGSDGWSNAGVVLGPRRVVVWRVLDAQYFGLAQRRKRVFVVASSRDGFDPVAVLLELEGVRRDSPPRRETGKAAPTIPSRSTAGGGLGTDFDCDGDLIASTGEISHCLNAGGMGRQDYETETVGANQTTGFIGDVVAHSLRGEGFDASEDGTGRGTPLVPIAFGWQNSSQQGASASASEHHTPTLDKSKTPAVAVALRGREGGATAELGDDCGHALRASQGGGDKPHVLAGMAVRRLTPRECERLQGFPDDYTLIPYRGKFAPDGPRYKALGNSWAVPVVAWIGRRIDAQFRGPCAKQTTRATIIAPDGRRFMGENDCRNPQATCPRGDMPTGVGYELCQSVCQQTGHAELNALRAAGQAARGGTLYLEGHYYACEPCKTAAEAAGVIIIVGKPPG